MAGSSPLLWILWALPASVNDRCSRADRRSRCFTAEGVEKSFNREARQLSRSSGPLTPH